MYLTQDELGGILTPILVYWLYSGFYEILGSLDKFKNYRLNLLKDEDTKNLVSKSDVVKGVLIQHVIQATISFFVFVASRDEKAATSNIEPTSPSLIVLVRQFVVGMIVLDTYISLLHWYMHANKFLYRHVHSWHHRLVVPYAYGAIYNHPVESFLSDLVGGALAFHVSGMSPRMAIFFFGFATAKIVDDHCGMWFGWNVIQLLFKNNTAYHEIHHKLYGTKYNFAQPFFTFWDKVLGTHMPYTVKKRNDGGLEVRPAKSNGCNS